MGRFQAMKRKKESRRIAEERMFLLHSLAEKSVLAGNQARARRYVLLLKRIGMRYNTPIPKRIKVTICRKCGSFLLHGQTARINLKRGRLQTHCLQCGNTRRYPYNNRRREHETKKQQVQ